MENIQIILYLVLIGLMIIGDAAFMETYKKSFRKGKAKAWENRIISMILSILATGILIVSGMYKPVFTLIGASVWVDYLIFCLVFWYVQLWVDMNIVKKVIKNFAIELLEKAGLEKDQIDSLMEIASNSSEKKAL
jgi:uncharacterized membrane protein